MNQIASTDCRYLRDNSISRNQNSLRCRRTFSRFKNPKPISTSQILKPTMTSNSQAEKAKMNTTRSRNSDDDKILVNRETLREAFKYLYSFYQMAPNMETVINADALKDYSDGCRYRVASMMGPMPQTRDNNTMNWYARERADVWETSGLEIPRLVYGEKVNPRQVVSIMCQALAEVHYDREREPDLNTLEGICQKWFSRYGYKCW